jgi:hypothetical protein
VRASIYLPPFRGQSDIQAALDALTALARYQLRTRRLPKLYSSGGIYQRAPARAGGSSEEWQTPAVTLASGRGDCEDLATWRAAETGGRAVPVRVRSGWHIIVINRDGSTEDPSRRLGM